MALLLGGGLLAYFTGTYIQDNIITPISDSISETKRDIIEYFEEQERIEKMEKTQLMLKEHREMRESIRVKYNLPVMDKK
jgi:hypothetical protein